MSGPVLFWITGGDRVQDLPEGRLLEPGSLLLRHLTKSLRAKEGDLFRFVDPDRPDQIFLGRVRSLSPLLIDLSCESAPSRLDGLMERSFDLAVGILKGESFEELIEPVTCLGARRLVPLVADRSQARWSREQFERKRPRFESKIREASQLSGRADRMRLEAPSSLSGLLGNREGAFVLFFDEEPSAPSLREVLAEERAGKEKLLAVTGPEGGWSDRERELFRDFEKTGNGSRTSLGNRILPGRLAPVVVASLLSQERDTALMKRTPE